MTDAMSATGMPDGEYRLGGFPVQVAGGKAMSGGVLAGSVLTLDRALSNFLAYTGAALEDGLGLLTRNPAAMTGLDVASLREGCKANLVAVDKDGKLIASFVNGLQAATN
jgi:N-acetylglucosamine-6-phosphate deacetylase